MLLGSLTDDWKPDVEIVLVLIGTVALAVRSPPHSVKIGLRDMLFAA